MWLGLHMYSRLEDRIRILCEKAIASEADSPETKAVLQELRLALHEHAERLRQRLQFPIPLDRRHKISA
jgi:hypothetical protein